MASLHPLIDNGLPKADPNKERGVLYCKCYAGSGQVEVALSSNVMFNHLCGSSQNLKRLHFDSNTDHHRLLEVLASKRRTFQCRRRGTLQ